MKLVARYTLDIYLEKGKIWREQQIDKIL